MVSLDMSYERARAIEDDNRRMAELSLQSVHQQHPIQRIIQYLSPNQPLVYSVEYQQQQQHRNLMALYHLLDSFYNYSIMM